MTDFAGVLQHQVQTLKGALHQQQERRCREIVAKAERDARQAIRDSREKLRERQRQAVHEERRRREHELQTARSRVETLERRRAFAEHEAVLRSLWPLLIEALKKRWADAEERREWCDMIVGEAAAALTGTNWIVEHPQDFSGEECDALRKHLQERDIAAPTFSACRDIANGLRIRSGSACLDGTAEGLLAERRDIEALLLAAWERQEEQRD